MRYEIIRNMNRTNEKELLKVKIENEIGYVVRNIKDNSEKFFNFYDNELAIEEFYKPIADDVEQEEVEVEEEKEFKNNTKMKVPFKYQHMLQEIDNEGRDSGIWAYSKEGYQFGVTGSHTLHEYNQKDLMAGIRTLRKCECKDCCKAW